MNEILEALYNITNSLSRCFIIVDALDECHVTGNCRMEFLSELFTLQTNTTANLFATSRFILEIENQFKSSMRLEIRASEADVRRYLEGHMSRLPSFVARNASLQDEIKAAIIDAADGMYVTYTRL